MGGRGQRLTIVGDVSADLVMGPISGWPRIGTETIVEHSEMRVGGSAGNAALAVSYLGGTPELLSAVGNDETGSWLSREFRALGVSLSVCDAPTTLTVGLIHSSGDRTFFTTRGHLDKLSYELLRPQLRPERAAHPTVLLSGPFLTPALQAAYPKLLRELGALGYSIALDTNWPPQGWSTALRAEVADWISCCDHVLLNDLEVTSLAGHDDLATAIERVRPMLKEGAALVVKTGARGAVGLEGERRCESAALQTHIFDTIGAGDSFNAGYLLARMDGAPLADALAAGCRAAAAIISRFPRRSIGAGELAGLRAAVPAVKTA
ncbi:MAG TPA: carbohydrate kinase family protein [Steroidobacteraceae bacterium]|jgi:ribokinase|nr:carbohydrate kinase family protein [Steroidobacteraceae bacterium]